MMDTGILDWVSQVIFVDDGSTDDTPSVIKELINKSEFKNKTVVVRSPVNQGRFVSRMIGAETASADRVLFLDSRIRLLDDFGDQLQSLSEEYRNLLGVVEIDVQRSLYSLYWDLSHRAIFRKHYQSTVKPTLLQKRNFDQLLKGTTCLLCDRKTFIEVCKSFKKVPLHDDGPVLEKLVERQPVCIHPHLRIAWVPRETLAGFLGRLWERGPSFAEEHLFRKRGKFYWSVWSVFIFLATALLCGFWDNDIWFFMVKILITLSVFSAFLLSFDAFTVVKILPLHLLVIFTFGFAIVRGIFVQWVR